MYNASQEGSPLLSIITTIKDTSASPGPACWLQWHPGTWSLVCWICQWSSQWPRWPLRCTWRWQWQIETTLCYPHREMCPRFSTLSIMVRREDRESAWSGGKYQIFIDLRLLVGCPQTQYGTSWTWLARNQCCRCTQPKLMQNSIESCVDTVNVNTRK